MFHFFIEQLAYWVVHFNAGHAAHLFGLVVWEDGSFSV